MGIDHRECAAEDHSDANEIDDSGASNVEPGSPHVESDTADGADRTALNVSYHEKVQADYRLADAYARWDEAQPKFEQEWADHVQGWPAREKDAIPLTQEARDIVRQGCSEFRETEENITTPATHRIEAADPERRLVGLDHRLKGEDRITEKVAAAMAEQSDLTPHEALGSVKDPIRYTFQYTEARYTEGVSADIERLKEERFELVELRNSWEREEYKGINSRWRVPENGHLFEVQFHTRISFEAKQLTHPAYERIRNPATPHAEILELRAFQRRVTADVPSPASAATIPDYP